MRRGHFELNTALLGGAVAGDGGTLLVEECSFVANAASTAGGAAHVEGSGMLLLAERSWLEANQAPPGAGASIFLAGGGQALYVLPSAPLGRWVAGSESCMGNNPQPGWLLAGCMLLAEAKKLQSVTNGTELSRLVQGGTDDEHYPFLCSPVRPCGI